MIVCAAVVGQQNQPLFLKTFPEATGEQLLKFNVIVHCSLDAVEERVTARRSPGEVVDPYLGLLYPTDDVKVYGLLTSTGVKFLVVLDDVAAKDETINRVLRRMHSMYVDLASNPFFVFGMPLQSARFEAGVEALAAAGL
ncbi:Sedlin [Haematococcus lacustris]